MCSQHVHVHVYYIIVYLSLCPRAARVMKTQEPTSQQWGSELGNGPWLHKNCCHGNRSCDSCELASRGVGKTARDE